MKIDINITVEVEGVKYALARTDEISDDISKSAEPTEFVNVVRCAIGSAVNVANDDIREKILSLKYSGMQEVSPGHFKMTQGCARLKK